MQTVCESLGYFKVWPLDSSFQLSWFYKRRELHTALPNHKQTEHTCPVEFYM